MKLSSIMAALSSGSKREINSMWTKIIYYLEKNRQITRTMSLFVRCGEKRLDTTTEKVKKPNSNSLRASTLLLIYIQEVLSGLLAWKQWLVRNGNFQHAGQTFKTSFVRIWRWKKTTSRLFDLSRLRRSLGRFETKETHEVDLWQVYRLGCLFIFGSVQMRLGCFYLSFTFSFSFSGRGI